MAQRPACWRRMGCILFMRAAGRGMLCRPEGVLPDAGSEARLLLREKLRARV